MNKKGFTLIELLAVIVVLAIVALITVPTVLGVIERLRKESYRDSIYGIMESGKIYLASHIDNISEKEEIEFTCDGSKCGGNKGELSFKGSVPKSGSIYVRGTGEVLVESLYNGKYYANGSSEEGIEITNDSPMTRSELEETILAMQEKYDREIASLKQENLELRQEITNQNNQSTAILKSQHESDVSNIWNKVGTEDISSLNGSISNTLLTHNNLLTNLTANRVLVSDGNGTISTSNITSTKLGYLSDVTANIQGQINNKQDASTALKKSDVVNNLSSSDTTVPLSAAQGKILNDKTIKIKAKEFAVDCSTYDSVIKMYVGTTSIASENPSGTIIAKIAEPVTYGAYQSGVAMTGIQGDTLRANVTAITKLSVMVYWFYY